jgi:outer membrane usher protein
VLDQTAIIGMNLADETQALRLNTTYTFTDDENLMQWRAGDIISGGTDWSRPVRLGGVQAQRAFSIRPDLVKSPLPSVSGSAAVPSAVDVYINGVKSYSKDVPAGPYQIDNIPAISGAGVAQVVTRDASGKESIQALSFYNSPQLLKPGLSDFSAETGYARSHYGIESFGYGEALLGSATLRMGITDWLTAEAHGEGGDGLVNGGAGVVASVFNSAVVSAAVSVSSSGQGTGTQLYGSFDTKAGPVSINGRIQHALDNYDDLATLTARENREIANSTLGGLPLIASGLFSYAPPRSVESLTLSMPIAFDKSTVSATLLRYETVNSEPTELVTASYSRPLTSKASMNATGYVDINDTSKAGLYIGVSMSLDDGISLSTGLSGRGEGDYTGNVSLNKPVSHEPGSWGWRINDLEGGSPYRSASVGYRGSAARVEAGLAQSESGVQASASVEGAVAVLGGNVYTANHIEDSFAVVDAHAPGVKVQRENLLVGTTNEDGKILIPNLNSYHRNKISIDPIDLPINAEPATTYDYITPSFRSGVYVDFDVKKATPNAIVILKMPDGSFVTAGSEGHIDGSDEPFVVGYDGQAFIRDLKAVNTIHVTLASGACSATFASDQSAEVQPIIGPEICQ